MNEEIERINQDDYIQTGEGGTALTYNNKNGKTLAKLFLPGIAANTSEQESRIHQVVYESGIPAPKPIRLITDGTRFGAEYELEAEVKKLYPYAAAKIIYVLSRLTNGRCPISEPLLQKIDKYLA